MIMGGDQKPIQHICLLLVVGYIDMVEYVVGDDSMDDVIVWIKHLLRF